MTEFTTLLQQGNAWFFIPSAILLGALHGLEPGHSKTMMAAFIIAIKGTIKQAVMLGLAATISHTAVVWLIAFGGMVISKRFTAQSAEPWLQLISAVIIISTAFWMFWRPGVIRRVIIGHLMITYGQTIKIIIAMMKTISMTLPIITRTILAVKIASLPI
jgi:ABC-type nickel/cobalt efflux system permease component RcnA